MSSIGINGTGLGSELAAIMNADSIVPGSPPSYQICKALYLFHVLGAKMAEAPIRMAQSQAREIAIPKSPEDRCKEAFLEEWQRLGADKHIFNVMRQSRVYGVASIAVLVDGKDTNEPIDPFDWPELTISFNVFDPLNTSGSLVLNQDPNALDFQKHRGIAVQGKSYHRSRCVVVLNEEPIYIAYTPSAFGYVGRSVYQRALYPMKSFIQSMVTDDMVTRKAGVLVAMMQQAGSIVDQMMQAVAGLKRQILKEAETDNVISVGQQDKIESLNMQNLDGAAGFARTNILKNIATAADMPAKLLENETLVEGFGEGSEDAKHIAQYIDRMRQEMNPVYAFLDDIAMHRAWTPAFYETIQKDFPDYRNVPYQRAFYDWKNSFSAVWPSLLAEPESEKVKTEEVKHKTVIATAQILLPELDPANKARTIDWVAQNLNENKTMFTAPLELDIAGLEEYLEEKSLSAMIQPQDQEPAQPKPFAAAVA